MFLKKYVSQRVSVSRFTPATVPLEVEIKSVKAARDLLSMDGMLEGGVARPVGGGGFEEGSSSSPIHPAARRGSTLDQRGRGLLVRVTDKDDSVTAHVD